MQVWVVGETVHVSTVKGSGPRGRALTVFTTDRFRHVWRSLPAPVDWQVWDNGG